MNNLDLIILKTLISNKKQALDFVNEHDAKLFTTDYWNFANLIIIYIKTYKELPTQRVIIEKLSDGKNDILIEKVKKTWEQLDKINVDDKEYKHELEKLKKRFAEKEILTLREKLTKFEPGSMDIGKAVGEMQKSTQNIKTLNQVKSFERKTLKEAVPIFREEYNAKMKNVNFDRGILTGYSFLDSATDGLRPGELLLIGGESGGGKSMLLMNMALQMWMQENNIDTDPKNFKPGNDVLYFSLEMPFKPCFNRVLARLSGNPSKKIRSSSLNQEEAEKLKKSLRFINNYPNQFEIVDIPRGATMQSLELIYEEAKAHYNPKIIVIDYLGLMDYDGPDMEDWLKLGKIAELIHEFSRVHNCVVLSAVQLNRARSGKDEEKVGMHRIGRSALIMQNANIAIQIETRSQEKLLFDMKATLIKNRDGELTSGSLIKNLACGTLLDQKPEENDTTFEMKDYGDISSKIELLDI